MDQERLSDLIGPYWGTYGIGYRVLQPLLGGPFLTPRVCMLARELLVVTLGARCR